VIKAFSSIAALFLSTILFSQSSCPNLGFEKGDLTSWSGSVGCKPQGTTDFDIHYGAACALPTLQTLDLPIALTINNLTGQQSIIESTWNGGVDPYVPLLSLDSPLPGNHVARIGDYYNGNDVGEAGGRVGELTYTLTVDSNNALLTAYYAIVLEAPDKHDPWETPYFKVRLLDPDGESVECVEYFQSGEAGADGFQNFNCPNGCTSSADGTTAGNLLVWRDWTAISVNLLPYLGQDVTIIFESGDCARTGHLGYSYIDLGCAPNKLLAQSTYICEGVDATLSAPDGMQNYEWHYGDSLGPIVGTTPNITVSDTGWYYCTLTPFSSAANSCPFTLPIYVEPAPSDPTAAYAWDPNPACIDQEITFTDESTTDDNSPLVFWQWTFDDGSPVSNDQNPTHSYSASGSYNVELVIESVDGCRDTISQVVEVLEPIEPIITPPGLICSEDDAFDLSGSPAGGAWSGVGIIDTAKGTFDPVLAYASQASPYTIRYDVGQCGEFTTLDVEITPQQVAEFPLIGPYCNDEPPVRLRPTVLGGIWGGTGVNTAGVFTPADAEIGDNVITYGFYGDCPDSTEQTIVVNPRKDATLTPVPDMCSNENPVQIEFAEDGGIWTGNGVSATGVFDPAAAGIGAHEIIYTHTDPCPDADTIVINVILKKDPSFDPFGPFCQFDAPFTVTPKETGGVWVGAGMDANGTFDPATAGPGKHIISYRFGEDCGGAHAEQIEVIAQPDASISGPSILCPKDDPVKIRPITTGGTFSGNGVDANGNFDPSGAPTNQDIVITYIIDGPCPDTGFHTIFIKDLLNSTITQVGPYCAESQDVILSAVDADGTWSGNGITDTDLGVFNPATAGEGTHTITYAIPGNCGTTSTIDIEVFRRPDPSINAIDPQCHNGAPVTITTAEPNGTFSGDILGAGVFNPASYGPGTHRIYYSFNDFCPSIDSLDIVVTTPIVLSDSTIDASCKDYCDGEIFITNSGGWDQSPYNYNWIGNVTGSPTTDALSLCDGTYKVIVSDLYGCSDSLSLTINEPDSLLYQTTVDSSSCGQANGAAYVTGVSGGTAPYFYSWDNGVTTPSNIDIATGPYKVTVSDSHQCTTPDSVFVGDRVGPAFSVKVDSVNCFEGNDGTAEIEGLDSGTSSNTIAWSTNQFANNTNHGSLSEGNYSVTITDATGCVATVDFYVPQPSPVQIHLPADTTVCYNTSHTIVANATGGTPGYNYYWNGAGPNSNTMTISNASTFDVYALDANSCPSDTKQITINYLDPLNIVAETSDTIICAGETVNLSASYSGGTGNYTFLWDDGNTSITRPFTPPGQYGDTVTIGITISDNCSPDAYDAATIVFFEPPHPAFDGFPTTGCDPLIVDFVDLSTNVDDYFWSLGEGTTRDIGGDFSHVYTKGVYDVSLHAVSPDGCEDKIIKLGYIESYANPEAALAYQPRPLTTLSDQVQFMDRSLGDINQWSWEFYNMNNVRLDSSFDRNPIINSPGEVGEYLAYLHVTTINGCVDSVWSTWEVEPKMTVYVPNSFTPNGDNVNEGFKPIVQGIQYDSYEFEVFDRWGERVWLTHDPDEYWNGNLRTNPYEKVKTDVYVWHLRLRDFKGIKHEFFGHVSILK
jgi:gliding motility-associated-like protein